MAKISVSIPDELKQQLDTYAQQTGFKRSAAVAHILEAYFTDQVRSPDEVETQDIASLQSELASIKTYLTQLHQTQPQQYPKPNWTAPDPTPKQSSFSNSILYQQSKGRE